MNTIPNTLHHCPQCWQQLASGHDVITGTPRICAICIVENVTRKSAPYYIVKSDEPQEQPEKEVRSNPPRPDKVAIYALLLLAGLFVGMFVGRIFLQVSGAGNP